MLLYIANTFNKERKKAKKIFKEKQKNKNKK